MHDLGLELAGFEIVLQCENNEYCLDILQKHWPNVRRHRDVSKLDGKKILDKFGAIDLLTGGFPCTDISVAGKQEGLGTQHEPTQRSGLFFEMLRIISDVRPRFLIIENVPALRTKGADIVLGLLAGEGYACRAMVVGAWHFGAPHKRERVWIVGVRKDLADNLRFWEQGFIGEGKRWLRALYGGKQSGTVADNNLQRREGKRVPSAKGRIDNPEVERPGETMAMPTATEYGSNQGGAAGRMGKKRPSLSGSVKDAESQTVETDPTSAIGADTSQLPQIWATPTASLNAPAEWKEGVRWKQPRAARNLHAQAIWATPRSSPNENRQMKPTPSQISGDHGMNLSTQAALWSTPRASQDWKPPCQSESERRSPALNTQVHMVASEDTWPTPAARDWKETGASEGAMGRRSPGLPARVRMSEESDGQCLPVPINMTGKNLGYLNYRWVSQLQMMPKDWLD